MILKTAFDGVSFMASIQRNLTLKLWKMEKGKSCEMEYKKINYKHLLLLLKASELEKNVFILLKSFIFEQFK